jgi:glycosyltransferase involved in cell wall biosynthesis
MYIWTRLAEGLRRGAPESARAEFLLVAPHVEPIVLELQRLLEGEHSIDIYRSATADIMGERVFAGTLRFYWLDPFVTMIRLALRAWRYRLIISYYDRSGYWLGLLNRLLRRRVGAKLVWIGFAPNPRGSGVRGSIREIVTYSALRGHDLIVCNTRQVIEASRRRFPEAADRFAYVRWGGAGGADPEAASDKGYVFSGGRTNRDFATVFAAVTQLGCPAVFVTSGAEPWPVDVPDHVAIHRDVSATEFERLLLGARVVVVALKHPDVSCGQVTLYRAMRCAKPILATRNAGIDEYVIDGKNALVVAPNDVDDLRAKLEALLADPDRRRELGLAARETIEREFNSHVFARGLAEQLRTVYPGRP